MTSEEVAISEPGQRWFSAAVLFRTDIQPDPPEEGWEYSISLVLFQSHVGREDETLREMIRTSNGEMPFDSGWEFVDILLTQEVSPNDQIVNGAEILSFFLGSERLADIRRQLE
jgi:hypothetical protein